MVIGFFLDNLCWSLNNVFFKAISTEVLQKVRLAPEHLPWRKISQGNLDLVRAVAE